MDWQSFHRLLTPFGQQALSDAVNLQPDEQDFLAHFQALCRQYPDDVARAALETAILRRAAASKFPDAGSMFFTREALEQASSYEVAAYRACRYQDQPRVADLGCSIGGDTLTLAGGPAPLVALDRDGVRLAMARHNLSALKPGVRAVFAQADLVDPLPLTFGTALYFDPARRAAGRRLHSVRQYSPSLEVIRDWLPRYPALGVKISPGVDLAELGDYDAEIEFISLRGDLKEACLWFGPLRRSLRRATLLPGPFSLQRDHLKAPHLPLGEPRAVLYEPDPAVLRAGLVTDLGVQLDAVQLDPDIAYLSADSWKPTPFARAWAVEDWFPFGIKRLRAYLRQRQVGRLVVKKRGSPLQPEELIRSMRLQGDQAKTVFLTHLDGKPVILVAGAEPLSS